MLESFIVSVLQTYIANYLEDFNSENIKISVFSGKIDLHNLKLNSKLLDNIPFPLKLKYGRIKNVNIVIPSILSIHNSKL